MANSLNKITTKSILDATVATADIAADAVTGAKIADDAVGSEHIEVLDAALQFGDSVKAQFGASNDLEIYHDTNHSYIKDNGTGAIKIVGDDVRIEDSAGNNIIKGTATAAELYYDGTRTLQTGTNGITVLGPEGGEANLEIYADEGDDNSDAWRIQATTGGDLLIQNYGGGAWDENIKCVANGGVHLYHDDTWKLKVESNGTHLSDSLHIPDSEVAAFGDGDDLKIYHDGTNNYIRSNGAKDIYINPKDTDVGVKVIADGAVELYHDNSKKLETASWGTAFTGNVSPAADNVSDLGATGARWVDAYLGGGLFIGGTGSANKLEDYEEGTWTPAYGSSSVTASSYTNTAGNYTKVGRLVTFTGRIQMSSSTVNSNALTLGGLPFTAVNDSTNRGGFYMTYQDNWFGSSSSATAQVTFMIGGGTAYGYFYDGDGTTINADDPYDGVKRTMYFEGFYYT